jgi:photosystem I P700 chlorophyll a apoprotein A1
MLNHHLVGLLRLGSLSWVEHQIYVSLLINKFLDVGVDAKEIPLPHEFLKLRSIVSKFHEGATPFFFLPSIGQTRKKITPELINHGKFS